MPKSAVMEQVPRISEDICNKWEIRCPEKRLDIENKIRAWIEPVKSDEIVDLLVKLLGHFVYYDYDQVTKQFDKLYRQELLTRFDSEQSLFEDSRFFPITKDDRKTSSHEIFYGNFSRHLSKNVCLNDVFTFLERQNHHLQQVNKAVTDYNKAEAQKDKLTELLSTESNPIALKSLEKKIDELMKHLPLLDHRRNEKLDNFDLIYVPNYIFVDDMIGTGETMVKFLKKFVRSFPTTEFKKLEEITIYLIVLEACEEGVARIESYCQSQNLKIFLIKNSDHPKAFKADHVYDATCCDTHKEKIRTFESQIIGSNHPLGYGESEALMAFYHNTPNNTLSSFWHESDHWKGIFPRKQHLKPNSTEKKNAARNVALGRARYL